MNRVNKAVKTASNLLESKELEQFVIAADDFVSRRNEEASARTELAESSQSLGDAPQILNRSLSREENGGTVNVINPVVVAKRHRSWGWVFLATLLILPALLTNALLSPLLPDFAALLFGLHYWAVWGVFAIFHLLRNSFVEIPDGCQALITRFGRVTRTVGAGRQVILDPFARVGYIVNVTREYPYNAPIREAPTQEQVNASVDLFLQFRINDPREFIFRLGGVRGFSEKLQNAISEQTRALIYAQRAEAIYDLIGESTSVMLESLNKQFMPAVAFVNVNITHAEPSSQAYRMDLAAAEMVRVATEAYTNQYGLDLRKKRDQGDLEGELASLRETLSDIEADIATFEAQIETATVREQDRAEAYGRQLSIEAEAEGRANVALFEAQALDIRALKSAIYPDILTYQFEKASLERIGEVARHLPQVVQIGTETTVDFRALSREMLGIKQTELYDAEALAHIKARIPAIAKRVRERHALIRQTATVDTKDIAPVEEVLGDSARLLEGERI